MGGIQYIGQWASEYFVLEDDALESGIIFDRRASACLAASLQWLLPTKHGLKKDNWRHVHEPTRLTVAL